MNDAALRVDAGGQHDLVAGGIEDLDTDSLLRKVSGDQAGELINGHGIQREVSFRLLASVELNGRRGREIGNAGIIYESKSSLRLLVGS